MAVTAAVRDELPVAGRLRLTEIFFSLQGEGLTAGVPTVFVRLTGCPLRCRYCDTAYAFHGGDWHGYDEIIGRVAEWPARHVCVTGGEPLAQPNCLGLLTALCDAGYEVSLETSGALDIAEVDERVSRVVDIKTPGSGEAKRNLWENVALLSARDQVKFVICDRRDFDWALERIDRHALTGRCPVFLSPSWGEVEPGELADWILAARAPVRLQLQLHKVLWGDVPGR
ncbi:MAG TPA: 7-carboxy-7-deazaguanine synthase QueE [Woeseiaceae bacterium]|nr:7-carboxy-7-deazaguanine synthase QueE [Woeseiaceae bacterium]